MCIYLLIFMCLCMYKSVYIYIYIQIQQWKGMNLAARMWAYATLALKDDPLFRRLLDASVARIEDHDTQNLANTSRGSCVLVRGGWAKYS